MAATSKQVNEYVYYLGAYGPKRSFVVETISNQDDSDQEDQYRINGEQKLYPESEVFDAKEDLLDYFDSLLQDLD